MILSSNLADIETSGPTHVAVGVFDGVHRGHQNLLAEMKKTAAAEHARTAVVTFFPHPKVITRGLTGRIYLTTLEERVKLLQAQGIDFVVTQNFDHEMRHTRAADFVERLHAHLGMAGLWSGEFGLGYRREGTAPVLREIGAEIGFSVHEFSKLLQIEGEGVSSTRIRETLAAGEMQKTRTFLGRPYALTGRVVHGDHRGRTIGFPTANLEVWEQLVIPNHGVYATYAYLRGERYRAATNIGVRPTVDGQQLRIEAHLIDFNGDLYGQELRLEFVERVRPEKKFGGLEELTAQIAADTAEIRALLH